MDGKTDSYDSESKEKKEERKNNEQAASVWKYKKYVKKLLIFRFEKQTSTG